MKANIELPQGERTGFPYWLWLWVVRRLHANHSIQLQCSPRRLHEKQMSTTFTIIHRLNHTHLSKTLEEIPEKEGQSFYETYRPIIFWEVQTKPFFFFLYHTVSVYLKTFYWLVVNLRPELFKIGQVTPAILSIPETPKGHLKLSVGKHFYVQTVLTTIWN